MKCYTPLKHEMLCVAIVSNHLLSLTLGLSNVKLIIVDLTVFSSQWPNDPNNPSN